MNDVRIPKHVGIILDGNGRWAKARGLSRSMGHKEGLNTLEELVPSIYNSGVEVLSIYVFSTENFKRPKKEVDYLMGLFANNFDRLETICNANNIKILFSGRKENLSKKVLEVEEQLEENTKMNTRGILNICLNYGGMCELVDMTKKIITEQVPVEEIDEEILRKHLYQELPLLDLLIRTGGEMRVSNFMLYQLAYAELYFTNVYFPDFKEEEWKKALTAYQHRDRRFGGIKDETKSH